MARVVESIKRSATKSATFRILILISDTIIIYAITGRYDQTIWLVILTNLASTLVYFLHERVWNFIKWGRRKVA